MARKLIPLPLRLLAKLLMKFDRPRLPASPQAGRWYKVPMPGLVCADGSPYHFYLRRGKANRLLVYFVGGGLSYDEYMAACPSSLDGEVGDEMFYFPNTRMAGMGVGKGVCGGQADNPFRDWSCITLPYCTGDFHCGTGEFPYEDKTGAKRVLHHHGYLNCSAAMERAIPVVGGKPEALVIFGTSAGGFGASLLADDVISRFPRCENIVVYNDSGFFLHPEWPSVVRDVWKAPAHIAEQVHSDNISLDCLQAVKEKYGDRVKVLFSCSTRDGDLSAVEEYIVNGHQEKNKATGLRQQEHLKVMVQSLMDTVPGAGLYIFDHPEQKGRSNDLTAHCIAVSDFTDDVVVEGKTVIQWVWDCVNGKVTRLGLPMLDESAHA